MIFLQAISCHYADSACDYIECEGVQDLISKEVTAIFKKRTGVEDARFQVRLSVLIISSFVIVSLVVFRMFGELKVDLFKVNELIYKTVIFFFSYTLICF